MTDRELRRLSRAELLELLLAQSREIDRLKAKVEELSGQLEDKEIIMRESGSIAEAALRLNHIFEDAQKAVDQYVYSMRCRYELPLKEFAEGGRLSEEAPDEMSTDKPAGGVLNTDSVLSEELPVAVQSSAARSTESTAEDGHAAFAPFDEDYYNDELDESAVDRIMSYDISDEDLRARKLLVDCILAEGLSYDRGDPDKPYADDLSSEE